MPRFQKKALIDQLKLDVQQVIRQVEQQTHPAGELLNRQPGPGSWSAAQVLEHLNFYNRFYLPRLEQKLNMKDANGSFKPGWLGNYFTKMMAPKADGAIANKMSAPKNAQPETNLNAARVVAEFLEGQSQLLSLLDRAVQADLNQRIPTSISSLIRLKSGDTFRFLVAHQQRHMAQLQRTLQAVSGN